MQYTAVMRKMGWILFSGLSLLSFAGCREPQQAHVSAIDQDSSLPYQLKSLAGVRDGDRLQAQAVFEMTEATLILDLDFEVGVPTRLTSGRFRIEEGLRTRSGSVTARSVTFLGGQSDRPNLGGIFELSERGQPLYLVTIPTMELASGRSLGSNGWTDQLGVFPGLQRAPGIADWEGRATFFSYPVEVPMAAAERKKCLI